MSAPLIPAAWTRTRISPAPGRGSGCSATAIAPSRTVAARTGRDSGRGPSGTRGKLFDSAYWRKVGFRPVERRAEGGQPMNPLHFPPIWRETGSPRELAGLLRSDLFRAPDPDLGAERPVLLIPGFLAGDGSLQ